MARHAACVCLLAVVLLCVASGVSAQQRRCFKTSRMAPFEASVRTSANKTTANGTVPAPNTCMAWLITVKYQENSTCSQSNGQLLFELWLEDAAGNPLPAGTNIQGIFLLASRQIQVTSSYDNGPPMVSYDANRRPVFDPPAAGAYDNLLSMTHMDTRGIASHYQIQRFAVPVGRLFTVQPEQRTEQNWYLSLVNTALQPLDNVRFAIRASCAPAPELPCPRPGRKFEECNLAGRCIREPSRPGNEQCLCNANATGPACGIAMTDLTTTGSSWQSFHAMPKTWTYFQVSIPVGARTRPNALLLVEVIKPLDSVAWYQPVLELTGQTNSSDSLPTLSDVDPIRFNLQGDCMCEVCDCYIPYQSQPLLYEMRQMAGTAGIYNWWIGVWNNAPATAIANASAGLMQIRARWNISDGGPPRHLCPMDCSGRGQCVRTTPGTAALGALYSCNCEPGFGGPYCEGTLQLLPQLSSSSSFNSGQISIRPGALNVYALTIDSNSIASGSNMLTISFASQPSASPMFVIITPVIASSVGQLYFQPSQAYVLNTTTRVPATFNLGQSRLYYTWWYVAVYNSNVTAAVPGTYTLSLTLPPNPSQAKFETLINKLQLGIIGAVAALIVLLLSFMTVRVLVLRRHMRRPLTADLSMLSINGHGPDMQNQARSMGVPPHVADSFLTFTYSEEMFRGLQHYRDDDSQHSMPDASKASLPGVQPDPPRLVLAGKAARAGGDLQGEGSEGACCDAPQCSVCLGCFEQGEVLTQLPCLHIFHKSCIDPWMMQHDTCPNCRTQLTGAVIPPPPPGVIPQRPSPPGVASPPAAGVEGVVVHVQQPSVGEAAPVAVAGRSRSGRRHRTADRHSRSQSQQLMQLQQQQHPQLQQQQQRQQQPPEEQELTQVQEQQQYRARSSNNRVAGEGQAAPAQDV